MVPQRYLTRECVPVAIHCLRVTPTPLSNRPNQVAHLPFIIYHLSFTIYHLYAYALDSEAHNILYVTVGTCEPILRIVWNAAIGVRRRLNLKAYSSR